MWGYIVSWTFCFSYFSSLLRRKSVLVRETYELLIDQDVQVGYQLRLAKVVE